MNGEVQIERIFALMSDGMWRTLEEIEQETGDPVQSISAQLRHLRKKRHGSHTVLKRRDGRMAYQYRLVVNRR